MAIAKKEIDIMVQVPLVELAVVAYKHPLVRNFNDLVRDMLRTTALKSAPEESKWPDVDTAVMYLNSIDFAYNHEVFQYAEKIVRQAMLQSNVADKLRSQVREDMTKLDTCTKDEGY